MCVLYIRRGGHPPAALFQIPSVSRPARPNRRRVSSFAFQASPFRFLLATCYSPLATAPLSPLPAPSSLLLHGTRVTGNGARCIFPLVYLERRLPLKNTTPAFSIACALFQKQDLTQTFSNLLVAHSFAKTSGVGVSQTSSFNLEPSTFDSPSLSPLPALPSLLLHGTRVTGNGARCIFPLVCQERRRRTLSPSPIPYSSLPRARPPAMHAQQALQFLSALCFTSQFSVYRGVGGLAPSTFNFSTLSLFSAPETMSCQLSTVSFPAPSRVTHSPPLPSHPLHLFPVGPINKNHVVKS